MSIYDTDRPLESISNEELRAAVNGVEPSFEKNNAAKELLFREYSNPVEASRFILKSDVGAKAKISAIGALGRTQDAAATQILKETLGSSNPAILRSAIWSLAKTGGARDLAHLKQVSQSIDDTSLNIVAAQRLLAFRNGVKGFSFKAHELPQKALLGQNDSTVIETKLATATRLEQLKHDILDEAPGLSLRAESAAEINCLGKSMWLVPAKELVEKPAKIREKPSVPIAIFCYNYCTQSLYLKAYILSDPTSDGAKLYVTRLRGLVTHVGDARLKDTSLSFKINSLKTRYYPAAELTGSLKSQGGLDFASATVSKKLDHQLALRRVPKVLTLE